MRLGRRKALPDVTPIVPVLHPEPFDHPAYLFEPKHDGFQGMLYLTGSEAGFRSKRGNVLRRFEQPCYWVRGELVERDVILDGEVIALDPEGRQDFRLLMRGIGNLHYAVFDVLWAGGTSSPPPSGWTSRESSPNGWPIPTRRIPSGVRSGTRRTPKCLGAVSWHGAMAQSASRKQAPPQPLT